MPGGDRGGPAAPQAPMPPGAAVETPGAIPATPVTGPLDDWDPADVDFLRALFLDEAGGHLHRISESFVALSHAAADPGYRPGPEIDGLFRALHTLKGAAGSVGHEAVARAAHGLEDLCADIRGGTLWPTPGIVEQMEEDLVALRALVEGARNVAAVGQQPANSGGPSAPTPLIDRRRRDDRRLFGDRRGSERTLRVDSDQLDQLLDRVGDLVILRTRIERRVSELESMRRDLQLTRGSYRRALNTLSVELSTRSPVTAQPGSSQRAIARLSELELELASAVSHLDRATQGLVAEAESLRRGTDQLDESVRQARLVRLDSIFHRLGGALRETEQAAGKRAVLVTSGGDLQLDKAVLEQLYDPLLHLLRNAVAHGIETPEGRRAVGKDEVGTIEITARLEGDFVFLVFADDGQGVDLTAARRALTDRGRAAETASDESVLAALFDVGFSTRAAADALSGRGMGLDVVKTTVLRLGGAVSCETTPGAGTRFHIAFPLVTAITEALLFKVGGQVYAIPAAYVVEAVQPGSLDVAPPVPGSRGEVMRTRDGAELPVLRLQSLFGVEMPPDHRIAAVQVKYGERAFILTCDRLIGPRTIVVRPVGPIIGLVPYYVGVTISGAGKAQLVLDLAALAEAAVAPDRPAVPSARRGPPRILVVDDSRLSREAAARVLQAAGLHVVTADDGWEAWELLGERRFDALVTDLEMPRVDGFHLIARARRESTLRGLPIVVVTSRTSQTTRDRAIRLGADLVITKSPNRRALAQGVLDLLQRRRAKDPAGP